MKNRPEEEKTLNDPKLKRIGEEDLLKDCQDIWDKFINGSFQLLEKNLGENEKVQKYLKYLSRNEEKHFISLGNQTNDRIAKAI
jgi:hypothetical protein